MGERVSNSYSLKGNLSGGKQLTLSFSALSDEQAIRVAREFLQPYASLIEDKMELFRSDSVAIVWNDPVDDNLFAET